GLELETDVAQYVVARGDAELLMHRDVTSSGSGTRGALRVKGHLKLTDEDIANGYAIAKVNIDESTFTKMMRFFIASEGNFDDYYTDVSKGMSKANAGLGFTNQKLVKLINRFAARPENAQAFHDLFGSLGIETTGDEYSLRLTRPLHGDAGSSYMKQIDPDYQRELAEGGVVLEAREFNRLAAVSLELNAAIAAALREEGFRAEFVAWFAEQTANAHEYPVGLGMTWGEVGHTFDKRYNSDSSLRTAWLMPYVHYNIAGAYGKQAFSKFRPCFAGIEEDGGLNRRSAAVLWWRSSERLRVKAEGKRKRWNLMTSEYQSHDWYQNLLAGAHDEVDLCRDSTAVGSKAEDTASDDEGADTNGQ